MPTFRHKELAAHYEDTGIGEPVVLLHAGASSGRQWRKVGALLDGRYRQIAPDLLGFGETEIWPGPDTLSHDHQADLVRALIGRVCADRIHLVGHSYGGSTAMRIVAADPDRVRSLTLIEPNLVPLLHQAGATELFEEYRRFAKGFIADATAGLRETAWESFVDLRNGKGTWRSMPQKARDRLLGMTQQTIDGFRSNLSNPVTLADCEAITVPTLVICGENTTAPERRITDILSETVPGCRYEIVPGAEHMSPVTHPQAVAALIAEHLATACN